MGKRRTSRQQRRMNPDYRRPRPERDRSGERRSKPRPGARLTRSGLPVIEDEEYVGLFADKSMQESFADMVEESLAAPEARQALREKKSGPGRPPSAADRLREYPAPQEELDLHRLTAPEAEVRIENFVQTARRRGLRTLRVITGKGLHSDGPAVLPEVAEHKLFALKERNLLLAYRWEKKKRERSGAIIIYLM